MARANTLAPRQTIPAGGDPSPDTSQASLDVQNTSAGVRDSSPTADPSHPTDQESRGTQRDSVGGAPSTTTRQSVIDTHPPAAGGGDSPSPETIQPATSNARAFRVGEFDLRAAVRQAITDSASPDPRVIAKAVEIPDWALRDCVGAMLPEFVRQMSAAAAPSSPSPSTKAQSRPTGKTSAGKGRQPGPSKRGAALKARRADWIRRLLTQPVYPGNGDWKFLGDCTRDDVLGLVQVRTDMAAANTAAAKQYEYLAEQMRINRAKTVTDLPDYSFEEAFK